MRKAQRESTGAPPEKKSHATTAVSEPPAVPDWMLPAIRGVQAGHEYYAVMVRLRDISSFFTPVDESLAPALRAQRALSKARIPKIMQYILGNPKDYTFSALTGAVDGLPTFEPASEKSRIGMLCIPRSMPVAILDGQHRRAAIEAAVREDGARKKGSVSLGDESIAVILFVDGGLEKAQQKFADLNRFAVRPNGSIGLLYDHRDETANLAKIVAAEVPLFQKLTDAEKTSTSGGSSKLFALSAIHAATKALLASTSHKPAEAKMIAVEFWTAVANAIPAWQTAAKGTVKAAELREQYVHAHAVTLQAIGRAGNTLLRERPDSWHDDVVHLAELDWSRTAEIWNGRAIVNGKVSKTGMSVVLTGNAIKAHLGLELGIDDRRFESYLGAGT